MSSPSQTPMEDYSKYPPQLCRETLGDVSGLFKSKKTESLPKKPAPSSDSKYFIHNGFSDCRRVNTLREQIIATVKEQKSKETKAAPNNPTTSTVEDTKVSPNPNQTCRYYFPKTASQEDAIASSHVPKSGNELLVAVAAAFKNLDLAAQELEGKASFEQEADFEMVENNEAMEDEDDMVVVEEPEEEDDYVEV